VPLEPATVNVEVPNGVLADVVIVKVELAPAAIEAGLNEAVAPVGKPLALTVTVPLKPLIAVSLTVYDKLLPWPTDALAGEAVSEKSGAPVMFNVTVAV
jgi:hypothetical protein